MKTARKYEQTGGDKKARQYRAVSESNVIGLIGDGDKKVEEEVRQCPHKNPSSTSASDFIILVRESPNPVNDVDDTSGSSCESMRKNIDQKVIYKPTNDANLYPDLADFSKPIHEEGTDGDVGAPSDTENKGNMESHVDETDCKRKGTEYPPVRSTQPRKGKLRFTTTARNHLRNMYPIYAFKYRCMLYLSIACCASVLFACLLSYLSYPK